jgi:hypothetical protein
MSTQTLETDAGVQATARQRILVPVDGSPLAEVGLTAASGCPNARRGYPITPAEAPTDEGGGPRDEEEWA